MVVPFKSIALAGALMLVAAPAFAQNTDPFGIGALIGGATAPLGAVDLDPLHIFTPAPAPKHKRKHHSRGHHARRHAFRSRF